MKKIRFSFRRIMSIGLAAAGIAILLSACKKDDDTGTRIPSAGLMVLNLAPDQEALGVALSGSFVSSTPLGYTNFNGRYQSIFTGVRDIEVYDYLTDSIIAEQSFDFKDTELYSLFVTGNDGVYKTVVVKDDVDSTASAEKAYIRFINAVPDSSSPVVKIDAGGTSVYDGPAAFNTVSPFTAVNEGDVSISIDGGSNISANRTITLEKGWVYTALIIGDPAAEDSAKQVQIRYIPNGIVPVSMDK